MTIRKEFSSLDSAPVTLYAKVSRAAAEVFALICDEISGSLVTTDYAHKEIHSGDSFTTGAVKDILNGGTFDLLITTPATSRIHITYEIDVEGESLFELFENVACGTGTTIAIYNRERASSLTCGTLAATDPVNVTTGSTRLRVLHIGSGQQVGGGDRSSHEFVFLPSTKYLLRITNLTALNNYSSLKVDYYCTRSGE